MAAAAASATLAYCVPANAPSWSVRQLLALPKPLPLYILQQQDSKPANVLPCLRFLLSQSRSLLYLKECNYSNESDSSLSIQRAYLVDEGQLSSLRLFSLYGRKDVHPSMAGEQKWNAGTLNGLLLLILKNSSVMTV